MSANVGEASELTMPTRTGRPPPTFSLWNHSINPVISCTKVGRMVRIHWPGFQANPFCAVPWIITTLSCGNRCCRAAVSGPPRAKPMAGFSSERMPGHRLAVCATS